MKNKKFPYWSNLSIWCPVFRSPIENISNEGNLLSVDEVESAIAEEFADTNVEVINENIVNMNQVEQIAQQFRSWKWIFGKAPKFSIEESFNVGDKQVDLYFRRGLENG